MLSFGNVRNFALRSWSYPTFGHLPVNSHLLMIHTTRACLNKGQVAAALNEPGSSTRTGLNRRILNFLGVWRGGSPKVSQTLKEGPIGPEYHHNEVPEPEVVEPLPANKKKVAYRKYSQNAKNLYNNLNQAFHKVDWKKHEETVNKSVKLAHNQLQKGYKKVKSVDYQGHYKKVKDKSNLYGKRVALASNQMASKALAKSNQIYKKITPKTESKLVAQLKAQAEAEEKLRRAYRKVQQLRKGGKCVRQNCTYEELYDSHTYKRDWLKSSTINSCLKVPYVGKSMLAVPATISPKHLSSTFWTPEQKLAYYRKVHTARQDPVYVVLDYIRQIKTNMDLPKRDRFAVAKISRADDTETVTNGKVMALAPYCKDQLDLNTSTNKDVLKAMCRFFELSTLGTAGQMVARLHDKAVDILDMDYKLSEMSITSLTPGQVVDINHLRGLNATAFSHKANVYWLVNWLYLSAACSKDDAVFLLYAALIHSSKYDERCFDGLSYGSFTRSQRVNSIVYR